MKPHFQLSDSPLVPFILIEDTDIEGLSRIFATLNTTGKLLTPFELVVAILFPQHVDLRDELEIAKDLYPIHYPNMDASGEIALQTCVLLAGGDPKKSLLPKTLTKEIWNTNNGKAFEALQSVGEFLSQQMGFPLDKTSGYTPYDSVFVPLAFVWGSIDFKSLDPVSRKKAFDRVMRYVVAASLIQRYQEGVHNKQRSDAQAVSSWIKSDDDSNAPPWIREATIPSLRRVDPAGAIGKTILCLLNRSAIRDPITDELVPLGGTLGEDHHIFPTKFVPTLTGWDKKSMNPNVVLNIMRVTKQTNRDFLNSDPRQQMLKARSVNQSRLMASLKLQAIPEECARVLEKAEKTSADFENFIDLREAEVQKLLRDEFGFPITTIEPEETDVES